MAREHHGTEGGRAPRCQIWLCAGGAVAGRARGAAELAPREGCQRCGAGATGGASALRSSQSRAPRYQPRSP
eukprot:4135305-Prymnesium_polylepis.1